MTTTTSSRETGVQGESRRARKTSRKQAERTPDRLPVAKLLALAAAGFVTMMSEMMSVGLIQDIARDLNTDLAGAARVLGVFALGCAVAAVPLAALTRGVERKKLLIGLMGIFFITTIITAVSNDLNLALGARLIAGMSAGVVWAILAGYAVSLAPPGQEGRAMSIAMMGTPLALAFGVPLGTFIGNLTSWRGTFQATAWATMLLIAIMAMILPNVPGEPPAQRKSVLEVFKLPGMPWVVITTIFFATGHMVAFNYFAIIVERTGQSGQAIAYGQLAFGVAAFFGLRYVGARVDAQLRIILLQMTALLAISLAIMALGAPWIVVVGLGIIAWGFAFGGTPTMLQTGSALNTGSSRDVGQAMIVAAWNGSVALAVEIGAPARETGGARAVLILGTIIAAAAVITTYVSGRAFASATDRAQEQQPDHWTDTSTSTSKSATPAASAVEAVAAIPRRIRTATGMMPAVPPATQQQPGQPVPLAVYDTNTTNPYAGQVIDLTDDEITSSATEPLSATGQQRVQHHQPPAAPSRIVRPQSAAQHRQRQQNVQPAQPAQPYAGQPAQPYAGQSAQPYAGQPAPAASYQPQNPQNPHHQAGTYSAHNQPRANQERTYPPAPQPPPRTFQPTTLPAYDSGDDEYTATEATGRHVAPADPHAANRPRNGRSGRRASHAPVDSPYTGGNQTQAQTTPPYTGGHHTPDVPRTLYSDRNTDIRVNPDRLTPHHTPHLSETGLATFETDISRIVVGHHKAIKAVGDVLRRTAADPTPGKPLASYLLVGPNGVGKTLLTKAIAERIYGTPNAVITVNLGEVSGSGTEHALCGHGHTPGQVTGPLSQLGAAVIVFENPENAPLDAGHILTEMTRNNTLTAHNGQTYDLSNSIICWSSCLPARSWMDQLSAPSTYLATVVEGIRNRLGSDIVHAIDDLIHLDPLMRDELRNIANARIQSIWNDLTVGQSTIVVSHEAQEQLARDSQDLASGARRLIEIITHEVEPLLHQALAKIGDPHNVELILDISPHEDRLVIHQKTSATLPPI